MLLLFLLAQAADPPAAGRAGPADPLATLHGIVVDNIRHCPKPVPGETVVCSKDRGFAETYRLPKLDPRFAAPPPPRTDVLAGTGAAGANPCVNVGQAGSTGCSLKDYQAWLAWQRQREAQARTER